MGNIYFRKVAKYSPQLGEMDEYDSYDLITKQVFSPGIVHDKAAKGENLKISTIFCSDLKRGLETAQLFATKNSIMVATKDLIEVKFSLKELLTRKEFEEYRSRLVRPRFVEAFISDTLQESRAKIQKRLFHFLNNLVNTKGDILVVSHSFLMKLMEVIIVNEMNIFEKPEDLRRFITVENKTYEFLGGFNTTHKDVQRTLGMEGIMTKLHSRIKGI